MKRLRPSPATVIATVALFAALSSPAWGAPVAKLITGKQIASNAITSPKVKDGSLLRKDFKKGQVPAGPKGAQGATGAPGPQGAQGIQGVQGIPGPTVTAAARTDSGTVGPMKGSLVDLASGNMTTGQIVLPWAGRIYATGFADFSNASSPTGATRTRCNLYISDGTGPNNGLAAFSPNAFGDTPAVDNYHVAVPLTGFVTKPAGIYNIAVHCEYVPDLLANRTVSYSAAVNAFAVPA